MPDDWWRGHALEHLYVFQRICTDSRIIPNDSKKCWNCPAWQNILMPVCRLWIPATVQYLPYACCAWWRTSGWRWRIPTSTWWPCWHHPRLHNLGGGCVHVPLPYGSSTRCAVLWSGCSLSTETQWKMFCIQLVSRTKIRLCWQCMTLIIEDSWWMRMLG